MTTAEVRSIVKTAATGLVGAKIWPNGLGFDLRGTSYQINEALSRSKGEPVWQCARTDGDISKYGEGATPQAAKRAARIGRDKHTQSRPL